jgi:CubicO group peptidase (beta-lactamase class C family)
MKAPPEEAVSGRLDERLAGITSRHPAVGLAVGVVGDGRLSSFHGHGLADIAAGTPVTEDTVFRIGSITKTFTAIAVLQLCEQRRRCWPAARASTARSSRPKPLPRCSRRTISPILACPG